MVSQRSFWRVGYFPWTLTPTSTFPQKLELELLFVINDDIVVIEKGVIS